MAHDLIGVLKYPFEINGNRINVGASVGISRFPVDGDTVDSLLQNADTAMYQAKAFGKGQVLGYDQLQAVDIRNRAHLKLQLQNAVQSRQFRLLYQPQVSCSTGLVEGVEALIRWHHPERGVVSPIEFIPIAEECGLINAIGAWVLAEAAKQISLWKDTELCDLRVSVNIASSQFQQPDFTDIVLNTLAQCGADPGNLELEVTESVVMNDVSTVVMRLKELREAGVRIAIDDFGTGYSSLSNCRIYRLMCSKLTVVSFRD